MNDEINKPSHYMIFPDMEAIDIIRKTLTAEEFKGYCKGNSLKYRLRAGEKGPAETCIAKAKVYEGWLKESLILTELWYPDDSGEWVEIARYDDLPKDTDIVFLLQRERDAKEYLSMSINTREFNESDFQSDVDAPVAYKKVAP